jgi:hypothetical protein
VSPPGEREGLAGGQVREWHIGGEAEGRLEPLVPKVVRTLQNLWPLAAPAKPRIARHPDARLPSDGVQDPEELGGTEGALVLLEAGREVDQAERVGAVVEEGLQHVRVREVALDSGGARRRADAEATALGLVEQRAEHRLRVEAG